MSVRAMDEPSCPWVLMEVSLEEKRMVLIGNSSARASNKVLRCTTLSTAPLLHLNKVVKKEEEKNERHKIRAKMQ